MKKTACQPTGEGLVQTSLSIQDRPSSVYHRRPNAVVRGLYHVFHWFGDFGPMFSALFGFFGRSLMVVVNFLILLGIIIISFSHSLELLRYAGLRNGLEWVGVFVWESAFIYSSIVLSRDFKNGTHGWAPWVGFLAGLTFVIVSNYTGMEDNPAGKIIGVSTPLLLLVFKGVLAHQFKNKQTTDRQSDTSDTQTIRHSEIDTLTSDTRTVSGKSETRQTVSQTADTSDSQTEETKPAKQTTKQTKASRTDAPKEAQSTRQSDKDNRTAPKPDSQTNRTSDNKTAAGQKASEQKSEQKPDTTGQSNGQSNIHKVIQQIIESEGKPPSIRQLAIQADVSKYKAEKALKEWREKKRVS